MARQADRTAQTRAAILEAAKTLFGAQGFAATTMDEIAQASGVAKGAVYHHFAGKERVFEAVFEAVSMEVARQVAAASAEATDVLASMATATRAYFTLCSEGPTGQVMLRDGPAVLGWARWREIDAQHFGGDIAKVLHLAMKQGLVPAQPVEPLARLFLGAVTEAAMACGEAEHPAAAGRAYAEALETLLDGLRARRPAR
ncbi:MAG TPA: TetR/AcrR family transcriptional regulator [Phenylobacterium sp.]|nr:TetR/AcrR family transcriptional regulator [Phenylobacterium sp.]